MHSQFFSVLPLPPATSTLAWKCLKLQ